MVESKLKVMLEQDYLSIKKHTVETPFMASHTSPFMASHTSPFMASHTSPFMASLNTDAINRVSTNNVNSLGSNIVREIVIPELTREVNEDKNFAQLRQVYNSLILATWYKKKIKDSILEQVYADKKKVVGVNIDDPKETQRIYQRYLQAFKKGVYNYIKEEAISVPGITSKEQGVLPKKYFSGGVSFAGEEGATNYLGIDKLIEPANAGQAMIAMDQEIEGNHNLAMITADAAPVSNDRAMTVRHEKNTKKIIWSKHLEGFIVHSLDVAKNIARNPLNEEQAALILELAQEIIKDEKDKNLGDFEVVTFMEEMIKGGVKGIIDGSFKQDTVEHLGGIGVASTENGNMSFASELLTDAQNDLDAKIVLKFTLIHETNHLLDFRNPGQRLGLKSLNTDDLNKIEVVDLLERSAIVRTSAYFDGVILTNGPKFAAIYHFPGDRIAIWTTKASRLRPWLFEGSEFARKPDTTSYARIMDYYDKFAQRPGDGAMMGEETSQSRVDEAMTAEKLAEDINKLGLRPITAVQIDQITEYANRVSNDVTLSDHSIGMNIGRIYNSVQVKAETTLDEGIERYAGWLTIPQTDRLKSHISTRVEMVPQSVPSDELVFKIHFFISKGLSKDRAYRPNKAKTRGEVDGAMQARKDLVDSSWMEVIYGLGEKKQFYPFVKEFLTLSHPFALSIFDGVDQLSDDQIIKEADLLIKTRPTQENNFYGIGMGFYPFTLRQLFLRPFSGTYGITQGLIADLGLLEEDIDGSLKSFGPLFVTNYLRKKYIIFKAIGIYSRNKDLIIIEDHDVPELVDTLLKPDEKNEINTMTASRLLNYMGPIKLLNGEARKISAGNLLKIIQGLTAKSEQWRQIFESPEYSIRGRVSDLVAIVNNAQLADAAMKVSLPKVLQDISVTELPRFWQINEINKDVKHLQEVRDKGFSALSDPAKKVLLYPQLANAKGGVAFTPEINAELNVFFRRSVSNPNGLSFSGVYDFMANIYEWKIWNTVGISEMPKNIQENAAKMFPVTTMDLYDPVYTIHKMLRGIKPNTWATEESLDNQFLVMKNRFRDPEYNDQEINRLKKTASPQRGSRIEGIDYNSPENLVSRLTEVNLRASLNLIENDGKAKQLFLGIMRMAWAWEEEDMYYRELYFDMLDGVYAGVGDEHEYDSSLIEWYRIENPGMWFGDGYINEPERQDLEWLVQKAMMPHKEHFGTLHPYLLIKGKVEPFKDIDWYGLEGRTGAQIQEAGMRIYSNLSAAKAQGFKGADDLWRKIRVRLQRLRTSDEAMAKREGRTDGAMNSENQDNAEGWSFNSPQRVRAMSIDDPLDVEDLIKYINKIYAQDAFLLLSENRNAKKDGVIKAYRSIAPQLQLFTVRELLDADWLPLSTPQEEQPTSVSQVMLALRRAADVFVPGPNSDQYRFGAVRYVLESYRDSIHEGIGVTFDEFIDEWLDQDFNPKTKVRVKVKGLAALTRLTLTNVEARTTKKGVAGIVGDIISADGPIDHLEKTVILYKSTVDSVFTGEDAAMTGENLTESLKARLHAVKHRDYLSTHIFRQLVHAFPIQGRLTFVLNDGERKTGLIDYNRSRYNQFFLKDDPKGFHLMDIGSVEAEDLTENDINFYINEGSPYIVSNESGTDTTLKSLRRENTGRGDVHVGVAGLFNLDVIAARRSFYGVMVDRDNKISRFFEELGRIIQGASTREDFITKFLEFIESPKGSGYISSKELRKDLLNPNGWLANEESFAYIKKMFQEKRLFFYRVDLRNNDVFGKISEWLDENGLRVDTLYISNIRDWFFKNSKGKILQGYNDALNRSLSLIADSRTQIIESGEGLIQHVVTIQNDPYFNGVKLRQPPTENEAMITSPPTQMKQVETTNQRMAGLTDKVEKTGGIDLTPANMNLQTQNSGGEIQFQMDPAMLERLQNAPGFVPVIINIQPMIDLRQFLGLAESPARQM